MAGYANTGGTEFTLPVRVLMMLNARLQFVLLYTVGRSPAGGSRGRHGRRSRTAPWRSARSTASPSSATRWRRRAAAHDAVEKGAVGKVLV